MLRSIRKTRTIVCTVVCALLLGLGRMRRVCGRRAVSSRRVRLGRSTSLKPFTAEEGVGWLGLVWGGGGRLMTPRFYTYFMLVLRVVVVSSSVRWRSLKLAITIGL